MKTDPNRHCTNFEENTFWATIHDAIAHPLMALTMYSGWSVRFHDFTSRKAWDRKAPKRTVRRDGVFETNSSSTHSICIDRGAFVLSNDIEVQDGVAMICGGEFGWEVEDFFDSTTKASYCLTYIEGQRECEPEEAERRTIMLENVVKRGTGAREVRFVNGQYDMIDHQSAWGEDQACEPAFESEDALYQFIFNRTSFLHTDNDNY